MKKLLLSIFLLSSVIESQAQLLVGSTAPDFTETDIDGNVWNLQELLDAGFKVGLIFGDVENVNHWESLAFGDAIYFNDTYGPNGSNEVRLFFVESNISNSIDAIYGLTSESQGDLTAVVNFPIIDASQSFLDTYQYLEDPFFPLQVDICEFGLITNLGGIWWLDMGSFGQCEGLTEGVEVETYYNATGNIACLNQVSTIVFNAGTEEVNAFDYTLSVDGSNITNSWSGQLLPFHTVTLTQTVEIITYPVTIDFALDINDSDPSDNSWTSEIFQSDQTTNHIQLNYANNTGWDTFFDFWVSGFDGAFYQEEYLEIANGQSQTIDIYLPISGCYYLEFMFFNDPGEDLSISHVLSNNEIEILYETPIDLELIWGGYWEFNVTEVLPFDLSATVFHDQNEDGIKDSFEPGIGNIEVHLGNQITYTDANGHYTFPNVNIEDYTELSIVYDETLWPVATTGSTIPIDNGMMTNFNFGLSNNDPFYLLQSYTSDPWFFCGFDGQLYISVSNEGNMAASGTLTATLDPLLTYTSASPTPLSFVGNTIVWDISALPVGGNAFFYVDVVAPTFEQMGETMTTTLNIITFDSDGIEVANNTIENSGIINCSYDPNDVTGFPTGETDAHFIHNGTQLEYLVRFQNTGNYQAFDIRVDDQLDSDLDFSTFEFVGSSHACVPVLNTETGFIQFYFNDINLPDSTTNEAASHGWLRYRISPQTPLAEMTTIENTAYIYFDFNPAVVTNTYVHTISDLYFGLDETTLPTISLYPNPANQTVVCNFNSNRFQSINVIDLSGKIILNESNLSNGQTTISTASLAEGAYIIEALRKDGMTSAHARLVIQH
jgi:uncharacterized repeat protein (TIGR01451 family)